MENTIVDRPKEADQYIFGTPNKATKILLIGLILSSILCFIVFLNWKHIAPNEPRNFRFVLLAMSVSFALPATLKDNWKQWVQFIANKNGLYFPKSIPSDKHTKWLLVPWENVDEMFVGQVGNKKGPTFNLKISIENIQTFFPKVKLPADHLENTDHKVNESYAIGLTSIFHNKNKVIKALFKYKG